MYALNCVYIFLVALLDSSDEDTQLRTWAREKKRRVLAKYEPLIEAEIFFARMWDSFFFRKIPFLLIILQLRFNVMMMMSVDRLGGV